MYSGLAATQLFHHKDPLCLVLAVHVGYLLGLQKQLVKKNTEVALVNSAAASKS